jgi:hypothetical protein
MDEHILVNVHGAVSHSFGSGVLRAAVSARRDEVLPDGDLINEGRREQLPKHFDLYLSSVRNTHTFSASTANLQCVRRSELRREVHSGARKVGLGDMADLRAELVDLLHRLKHA